MPDNVEKCRRNLEIDEVMLSFTWGNFNPGDVGGQSSKRKAPACLVIVSSRDSNRSLSSALFTGSNSSSLSLSTFMGLS